MSLKRVVVVGGNVAGLRTVQTLRADGFDGALTLISSEHDLPYDRPPLSKDVLTGGKQVEDTTFRDGDYYADADVELLLGHVATHLDLSERTVIANDERVPFDGLVIACGASARTVEAWSAFEGVHSLRTMQDARAIRAELERSPRVVVIGAGFIGAEVASSARALGLDVTILEALPVPLVRAVGTEVGMACARLHKANGVALRCGVAVERIEGNGRVERVELTDGTALEADLVVMGIGVAPNVGWLEDSGLTLNNGVVCDETLNAGPDGVFAVGDVSSWVNPVFGVRMRCEQWTNAVEQGIHAARNLLAGTARTPYRGGCYFWSDQYGRRIQFAGITAADHITVAGGPIEDEPYVALYRSGPRIVGVLGVGCPKLVMQTKLLIEREASWEDALALLEATEMKPVVDDVAPV